MAGARNTRNVDGCESLQDDTEKPRIAIAGFQHETNCFSPITTTLKDFVRADGWPGLTQGDGVLTTFPGTNIPIGGFIEATRRQARLVPILWASAEPSDKIHDDAFQTISDLICDGFVANQPLDGIYLDLHGAMVAQSCEDGEGALLQRIRHRFGSEIPVAVSLDLHANITEEMASLADVLTVFRTYPHLDMAATGARAGNLLLEIIESDRKPHTAFRKLPFLVPLQAQCTDMEPAHSLYGSLPDTCSLGSGTADLAMGFPASDIAMCGPSIVASAFDPLIAERMASHTEHLLLNSESRFSVALETPGDAVCRAIRVGRPGRPAILADVQDNSGAGATSDTTGLLAELVRAGASRVAVGAIFDPEVAAAAHEAGVDSRIHLALGGRWEGSENPAFQSEFRVMSLSDGRFDYRGEMMRGIRANIGPSAALQVVGCADIRVVVTSMRIQCLDRAVFSHLGIEPEDMSVLAVKSTVHFRADFAPFASEIIPVEVPGYNPCRLDAIPFSRLRSGIRLL